MSDSPNTTPPGASSFPTTTTTVRVNNLVNNPEELQSLSIPSSLPALRRAPSWTIDTIPAYCITLERRADRWRRFQDQPGLAGLNVGRFLGVDGKTIDWRTDPRIGTMTKRNLELGTRRSHEELDSVGGVGCALSHIALWTWMVETDQDYCLIFEDDAVVPDGFTEKANRLIRDSVVLRQPGGWDMWLLGGIWDDRSSIPQEPRSTGLIRIGSFMLFHAYVMTKSMAKRLLEDVYPIHAHIDLWTSVFAYMNDLRVVGSLRLQLQQNTRVRTDIQTAAATGNSCQLCDVPTQYKEEYELVPKTTWRAMQLVAMGAGFMTVAWMYRRLLSSSSSSPSG